MVTEVDLAALRAVRERRMGHNPLAHLRSEAYVPAQRPLYPAGSYPSATQSTDERQWMTTKS